MTRLASSRFETSAGFELDEHGPLLHRLAGLHEDAGDDARRIRAELVLHLHRLHDDDALAGLDGLPGLDFDADDEPGHGCADGLWPGRGRGGCCGGAKGVGALVRDLDVEGVAIQLERPLAGTVAAGGEQVAAALSEEVAERRAGRAGELGGHRRAVDGDGVAVDDDIEAAAGEGHDVTHSSSATVSTWVVWGNRSKQRRPRSRKAGRSRARSRASVAGSQLTWMSRAGGRAARASGTAACRPRRGGLRTTRCAGGAAASRASARSARPSVPG